MARKRDYRSNNISKDFIEAVCMATILVSFGSCIVENYFLWTVVSIIILIAILELLSFIVAKVSAADVIADDDTNKEYLSKESKEVGCRKNAGISNTPRRRKITMLGLRKISWFKSSPQRKDSQQQLDSPQQRDMLQRKNSQQMDTPQQKNSQQKDTPQQMDTQQQNDDETIV